MTDSNRMSVPQIAQLLFVAVVALARACDGARSLDGQGFNKFDAERGHRFAAEDSIGWNAAKCSYVKRFLHRYRVQLLEQHNIDLEAIPDPSEYVHPRRVAFDQSYGGQFLIAWDYNDAQFGEIKDAVKALEQRRYQGGQKVWSVPIDLAHEVAELAEKFGFEVVDSAKKMLDRADSIERSENVTLDEVKGHIVFRFPYDPEMLNVLKSTWRDRRWDRDERVWRVKLQTKEEYESVIGFSKRFELTVSDEVRTLVASTFGAEESQGISPGRPREEDEPKVAPTDDELYGNAEEFVESQEDIEEYHERDMGRDWKAGDAKKLFE